MIGTSRAFHQLATLIEKVARFDAPTLLGGETGTGKELTARAVHYGSDRRGNAFVPVNCGAIPDTLFESELFGHRRGAFTGAHDDQPGVIGLADQGTVFLDEVDALSPKGQVALLRFLQDQRYRPLGGRAWVQANVRVLAASNRDLDELARGGAFRTDLLYRLKLLCVRVPPLRERTGDPALLARHFVEAASVRFRVPPKAIAAPTLEWFDRYAWPGNIRELEHLIYREFLLGEQHEIEIPAPEGCATATTTTTMTAPPLSYRQAKIHAIERFEREFLSDVMRRAGGSISAAARLVQTERRHLAKLLKRYGVARVPSRA